MCNETPNKGCDGALRFKSKIKGENVGPRVVGSSMIICSSQLWSMNSVALVVAGR